jgi:serine phosphatase RsbU (regulator of sigma subunit)
VRKPTDQTTRERVRRLLPRLILPTLVVAVLWATGYLLEVPVVSVLARFSLWLVVTGVLLWGLWGLYQRLLWRVSGRLAFSYFLIGVLPIPLAAILILLVAYLISGFFLGHLYRDALHDLELEIEAVAAHAAARDLGELTGRAAGLLETPATEAEVAYGAYRAGRRVAGDPRAPETWPEWLAERAGDDSYAYTVLPDGAVTLAATGGEASGGGRGVVAFYTGDLGELLRRRSGLWVSLLRGTEDTESTRISIGSAGFKLGTDPLTPEEQTEVQDRKERFFRERARTDEPPEDGAATDGIDDVRDRPLLNWVEIEEPARELVSGRSMGGELAVLLTASPRIVAHNLLSPSAEVGEFYWVALVSVSLLLLTIYAVAELVALAMIIGLSRAVTRLYRATSGVASGDFSVRIPVRRRDQVGALQRSFNAMAENLEDLVATAAQKELLEKELQIARQVQQSLIPKDLPRGDAIDFSTLFEPSAAIGGDYFDVLRLSDDEVAVVIADVSGHGLPTGLRMAMVKAALGILVSETHEPDEILRRLDSTVRSGDQSGDESRFFVTASFARVDFRRGAIDLTNAGHPPTYLVRGGATEEILLPSSPLGGLGHDYASRRIDLEDGDAVVWLSDGMIEATNGEGDPFGYERVQDALAGPAPTAQTVRDRLVAAVDAHTGGRPAQDDRTLVVLHYRTAGDASGA